MKKKSLITFMVIALFIILAGSPASAAAVDQPARAGDSPDSVIAKYRELIPQEMRKRNIPGMAIAIVDDNQVVWSEAFGFTDSDRKTPVTIDTPFSIQSMTKSFTAAAVMLAVQDGLVDLDTPISAYLPDFHVNSIFEDRPEDKITLRHLLSHTAGFTHDAPIGNNNDLGTDTWEAHIASISQTWLLFPVGSRYNYTNNGIDLAAHIVEVRAGMPFTQYVQTRLLDPLGMTHSSLDIDVIRAMPDRAIGHSVFSNKIPVSPIMAAGGLYTSASDLANFLRFYLNLGTVNVGTPEETQVLAADLVKEMYNGQFRASTDHGYGLGLALYRAHDASNTLQVTHGGGGFGFLADIAWFPQLNFGIAWLTNSSDHDLQSWLTGQIIEDYINATRSTMVMRANQSERFNQKSLGPQDPAVLSDASLTELIQSMALSTDPEAVTRRRALTGFYSLDAWGRTAEVHKVFLKNGLITLDGAALTEVQPGLFFANNGEVLDLRGPDYYLKNVKLEKVGLAALIFYLVFLGLCGIGCLAILFWHPARWVLGKVRRKPLAPRAPWSAWVGGVFIILAALVGLVMLVVIWIYPALLGLHRFILPTTELSTNENIAANTPYLLLALALIAAVFSALGWKRWQPSERWIEAGKIGLLVIFALVVI